MVVVILLNKETEVPGTLIRSKIWGCPEDEMHTVGTQTLFFYQELLGASATLPNPGFFCCGWL